MRQIVARGVTVMISSGGREPGDCEWLQQRRLIAGRTSGVLSRYGVGMLDFDMEASDTLGDGPGLPALDQALKGLKAANPNLVFPSPSGAADLAAQQAPPFLTSRIRKGFNPDVINVMAMDDGRASSGSAHGNTTIGREVHVGNHRDSDLHSRSETRMRMNEG